jgi:hypothetical protein
MLGARTNSGALPSAGVAAAPRLAFSLRGYRPAPLTGRCRHGTFVRTSGRRASAMFKTMSAKVFAGKAIWRIAGIALVLALGVLALKPARAATWLEKNFWMSGPRYDRAMPACDYAGALDRIIANFRTKEYGFWNSQLRIVGVENIREIDTMPWAAQSIPRRYCSGTAVISDGAKHPLFYSIGEDTGIIGMDWGVNFCVAGLDRNSAYSPDCRAAKP